MRPYEKPWLDIEGQLKKLSDRGLIIEDAEEAKRFLSYINYYRFTGFCLPFQKWDEKREDRVFVGKVTFSDEVDKSIEDGAHKKMRFFEWRKKIIGETKRSKEVFVAHFKETYTNYPDLPVWAMSEVCSFGSLSCMFENMLKAQRKDIAAAYKVQPCFLESWLHSLTYLRNVCAHHGRLWDKRLSIQPELPPGHKWETFRSRANLIITSAMLMNWILAHDSFDPVVHRQWKKAFDTVVSRFEERFPQLRSKLGVDFSWRDEDVWKEDA